MADDDTASVPAADPKPIEQQSAVKSEAEKAKS
jgi:hypothetical protein